MKRPAEVVESDWQSSQCDIAVGSRIAQTEGRFIQIAGQPRQERGLVAVERIAKLKAQRAVFGGI